MKEGRLEVLGGLGVVSALVVPKGGIMVVAGEVGALGLIQ